MYFLWCYDILALKYDAVLLNEFRWTAEKYSYTETKITYAIFLPENKERLRRDFLVMEMWTHC